MPQTTAAEKALRVSERRRALNDHWRSKLRSTERKLEKAVKEARGGDAKTLYVAFQSILDRMARRHILHRNTVARRKARFAVRLNVLRAAHTVT